MPYGNAIILFSCLAFSFIFFSKRLRASIMWRATVTPLASIIGSGFLISAPLLVLTVGKWAAWVMLLITVIAYALGSIIRFNIRYFEPILNSTVNDSSKPHLRLLIRLEKLSKPALGIAYIISVAFYLKILAIFFLSGFHIANNFMANIITTSILMLMGGVAWRTGLSILEILEKYAVNIKLIIIFSMLVGYFFYNANLMLSQTWGIGVHEHYTQFEALQRVLGILIIVQGFETSRYLGKLYSVETRIQSMRYAQLISGFIYVIFIATAMTMFKDIHVITESVVIDLCRLIAPILPFLLIVAAMFSQFSAAVADAMGSAGLISEASKEKLNIKQATLITISISIGLTWLTNLFEIVVIASKAFAIYYALQSLIAIFILKSESKTKVNYRTTKLILYIVIFILMLLVINLGTSIE